MTRLKNSEQKKAFAHMWDFISRILEDPEIVPKIPDEVRNKGRAVIADAFHTSDQEILDEKGLFSHE